VTKQFFDALGLLDSVIPKLISALASQEAETERQQKRYGRQPLFYAHRRTSLEFRIKRRRGESRNSFSAYIPCSLILWMPLTGVRHFCLFS